MNKKESTTLFQEQQPTAEIQDQQPLSVQETNKAIASKIEDKELHWLQVYAESGGNLMEVFKTPSGRKVMLDAFAAKFKIPDSHRSIIPPFLISMISRGLNPLVHAWAYNYSLDKVMKEEDKKAAWTLQVSDAGLTYLASKVPGYAGMITGFVYDGDTFEYKNTNGKIEISHVGNPFQPKGNRLGAYALATIGETKYFGFCREDQGKTTGAWRDNKPQMLVVRAITAALKPVVSIDIDAQETEIIPPEKQLPAAHEVPALPPGIEEVQETGFKLVEETDPVERLKKELEDRGIVIPDPIQYLKDKTENFDPAKLDNLEFFETCLDIIVKFQAKK